MAAGVAIERERGGELRGRALNDLGNAYVAAGDVSNAIDTLREAVEVKRSSGGKVQGVR